jgi:hypothetical protein
MTELFLIRLDATNGPAFDDLFRVTNPSDDIECTTVSDPEHTAAIYDFLATHQDALLPGAGRIKTENGEGTFYSWDGQLVKALRAPVKAPENEREADQRRLDYVNYLRKLIFVEVRDKKNDDGTTAKAVHVSMDPLPLGQRIGMFFRASKEDTWSILYEQSVSKLVYIDQLIHHKGLEELGLEAQLTIYKFANGTEILSRNYMLQHNVPGATPFEGAGTMYVRSPKGEVNHFMVPEDSFTDFFEPKKDYVARLIERYGPLAGKPINVTSAIQCAHLVRGETQFAVYRTQRTKDRNTIGGDCLQRDKDGDPVIQGKIASMLEPLVETIYRALQTASLKPPENPVKPFKSTPPAGRHMRF